MSFSAHGKEALIMSSNRNKHLSQMDRNIIHQGIINGSSKKSIADTLGKDPSTIGKEIKLHRHIKRKLRYSIDCDLFPTCKNKNSIICSESCPDFKLFSCSRRDRSPGSCDGCSKFKHCPRDVYSYDPETAHDEYQYTLVDSREGVNLTAAEAKEIGDIIAPLIKQGQSPEMILLNHPEIEVSLKTIYTYIDLGVFECVGIKNIDLHRKTRRKMSKNKQAVYKKRKDNSYLEGRKYTDYEEYAASNINAPVVEMDTVYNNVSDGPFIQTFLFVQYGFLFAIYHEARNAESMKVGVDLLEKMLGKELFINNIDILLTDRGTEFSDAEGIETSSDGSKRTHLFYCDAMRSCQKPHVENKHIELRYILPKNYDLRDLGLTDQKALNKVLSHINSAARKKLGGKSSIELMEFLNPELFEKFQNSGIQKIEKDKINLKPSLLKPNK